MAPSQLAGIRDLTSEKLAMDFVKKIGLNVLRVLTLAGMNLLLMSAAHADSCDVVTINGSDVWQPVSYRDGGQLAGIAPDILRRAFAEIGVAVEVAAPQPWKRLLGSAAIGTTDIVAGAYVNAERARKYHYSDALFADEVRIFVKKGREFHYQTLDDLIGKSGAMPLGASYGEAFDRYADEHLQLYEPGSYPAMFQMLITGRIDYVVLAHLDGVAELRSTDLNSNISILPNPVAVNEVYALFSKASPCSGLLERFNQQLHALKESGAMQQIVDGYLRSE